MRQRIFARLCLWGMILVGVVFMLSIFAVPRFAAEFAASETPLPWLLRATVGLGRLMAAYGWFFGVSYLFLFLMVVVWICTTKSSRA